MSRIIRIFWVYGVSAHNILIFCYQIPLTCWIFYCMYSFYFLTFPACFSIQIIFSNFDFNCSNLSSLRNLQEQVKKAFCYQELFWPFTVWINCFSDLKNFANSRPSASNFKSFFSIIRTIFSHSRSEEFW